MRRIPKRFAVLTTLLLLASRHATPSASVPRSAEPLPRGSTLRLPAEFERQEALFLSCAQLVQFHPKVYVDVVRHSHERIRVVGLTGSEEDEARARMLLREARLPTDAVEFVDVGVQSMWLRDFAPLFVQGPEGRSHLVDGHYVGTEFNAGDDSIPARLAARFQLPLSRMPLSIEGGNILSNGAGFVLNAKALLVRNREERGLEPGAIDGLLHEYLGVRQRAYVRGLIGEPTQHVDMFCSFLAPDLLVVGSYAASEDSANAALLDEIASTLNGLQTAAGPLRVARIPMPPKSDGRWRSYTNVIFANGLLLVPQYPDVSARLDEEALRIYRDLLPDWEVVGIDASTLIRRNGALHCVSSNLPLPRNGAEMLPLNLNR